MTGDLSFRSGLKDVLPTVFGYIGVGLAFGVVAHTAGIAWWLVALMSLIVYGGSVQFVLATMLAAASPISAMLVSAILINSRMSLMSMTVAPYIKEESLLQNIMIGTLLTDETFALSMNKVNYTDHKLKPAWFHAANVGAYLVWMLATVVGALLGGLIPNPNAFGLDFAAVAMFIGLLYLQMIGDRSKPLVRQAQIVVVVMVMMYVLMRFFPGSTAMLIATVAGCLIGMGVERAHV
ncbi:MULTISPECIES: AzlC family ABC transporter permease [unclassified Lacticaseibacillus]|uniref:AzlC family ABC transporter permease n=1 Tax=unclassified Lacticaseibacillus TaxID=2759744 RepID=UPI00194157E5|nr:MULTISPECIES: AzlC family ABC transporter permease [unclassified Lacticaseibacillus]